MKSPILVTGSHRSGSTWIGRMISQHSSISYIHEPFNIKLNNLLGMEYWYTYINEENEHLYKSKIKRICELKYPIFRAVRESHSMRDLGRALRDWVQLCVHRAAGHTPLIKDPIAIFSAEWLARKFDMKVIVVIRHPAAFAGSLKVKNWTFPFTHFTNQPLLMNGPLSPFKQEVRKFVGQEPDIIDQAILLWNIIYNVVSEYRIKHKQWIFVRHEDIAQAPIESFHTLYKLLGLEFNSAIKGHIRKYSKDTSETEVNEDHEGIKRNSKSVIYNWKDRLTSDEIERIRRGTATVARQFYDDGEW